MALQYSPKVGEIIECDFGIHRAPRLSPIFDGGLPNEMVKRRLVVVLNGKLPNGCCMVVPLSSKGSLTALQRGFHVPVPKEHIAVTTTWDARERWAIAECLAHVSKERLFQVKNQGAPVKSMLPSTLVALIQKAVIRTINANRLFEAPTV